MKEDNRHETQGTRHKAQGTRHKAQGTRHKAQSTRHLGVKLGAMKPEFCSDFIQLF